MSKVISLFVPSDAAASASDVTDMNAQKMPLLEAPSSPLVPGGNTPDLTVINTTLTPQAPINNLVNNSDISAPSSDNSANNQSSNQITNYKVKQGDTVTSIAKKFNISINTVLWANNLRKDSTLSVGKNLTILPISGVSYTVKPGDTLQTIASKYKGDLQEILSYNNLDSTNQIHPGDVIVIPDGEMAASTPQTQPKSSSLIKTVASLGVGIASADTNTASNISVGYYMRPIKAGVKTQGIHDNNAVDLADSCGTSVYASAAGDVIIAKNNGGWNGGYGNYVVINHSNGSQTLYAHFSEVEVTEGQHVTQGQLVGLMGETGKATGCHVHFEIRNGPVNPF